MSHAALTPALSTYTANPVLNARTYDLSGCITDISRNDVPSQVPHLSEIQFSRTADYFLANNYKKMATRRGATRLRSTRVHSMRKEHSDKVWAWESKCACRFVPLRCNGKLLYDATISDCLCLDSATVTRTLRRASKAAKAYVSASVPSTSPPSVTIRTYNGYLGAATEEGLPWMTGPDGRQWLDHASIIRPSEDLAQHAAAHLSYYVFSEEDFFHPLFLKDLHQQPKHDPSLTYDQILTAGHSDDWTLHNLSLHNRQIELDLAYGNTSFARWAAGCSSKTTPDKKPNAQGMFNVTHHVNIPGLEQLAANLTQLNAKMNWGSFLRELTFCGLHIYQANFSIASVVTSLSQLTLNLDTEFRNRIVTSILSMFGRNNAQSDAGKHIGAGLAAAAVLVTALATNALPEARSIDRFLSRFGALGRNISTIEKLISVSNSWTKEIVKFIGVHFLGHDATSYDCWHQINDWCDEVSALMTTDFESRSRSDPKVLATINSLLQRGNQISKELDAARVPFAQRSAVTSATQFLYQARRIASSSGAGQVAPRIAPNVVHFYGPSGAGKSSMLGYLNTDILIALGSTSKQDLHDKVYYRRPVDENWDGYKNGTMIVVCDDFGALKDTASRPNPQVQEQIHMSNTSHFPLPMAHLEDKGTTVFDPSAIIWTTNRSHFSFESMTNPEAVYNRVGLKFRCRIPDKFAQTKNVANQTIRTLDPVELEKAFGTDPQADLKAMIFDRMHPTSLSEEVLTPDLTYEKMRDLVVAAILDQQQRGRSFLKRQEDYFERRLNAQAVNFVAPSWYEVIRHPRGGYKVHVDVFATLRNVEPISFPLGTPLPTRNVVSECVILDACSADEAIGELKYAMSQENGIAHWLAKWVPVECHDHTKLSQVDEMEVVHSIRNTMRRTKSLLTSFIRKHSTALGTVLWGVLFGAYIYLGHTHQQKVWNKASEDLRKRLLNGEFSEEDTQILLAELDREEGTSSDPEVTSRRSAKRNGEAYAKDSSRPARKNVETYHKDSARPPTRNVESEARSALRTTPPANAGAWGTQLPVKTAPTDDLISNTQGLTDPAAGDIRRSLYKNVWMFQSFMDGRWVAHGSCLFVRGRLAITNRHILATCGDYISITSLHGNRTYDFKKTDLNIHAFPSDSKHGYKDVVAFECPRSVALHGDASKYFMSKSDFSHHDFLSRMCLVGYDHGGFMKVQETDCVRAVDQANFQLVDSSYNVSYIRETYEYALNTDYGDCGSVAISFDSRSPRKIFGLHMASGAPGSKYSGVAVALHRESLEELLGGLELRWKESAGDATVPLRSPCDPQVVVNANGARLCAPESPIGLAQLGETKREFANTSTQLRPTPVAHLLPPPTTQPAHLKRHNGIDPALKAMEKAVTDTVTCDQERVDRAASAVRQMWNVNINPRDKRVLSHQEAIAGIEGDDVYAPVNRQAGAGYGWPKLGQGKTHWLGKDDYIFDDPDVLRRCEEMETALKQGKRVEVAWNDTLKDELRSEEKIAAVKTRLFSAGEMCLTILLRKYFMGWCAHRMRNPVNNESCVGMNPTGYDWTRLARRLQSKGKAVVAGDFSNYDGTLCTQVLWAVYDNVESHYTDATDEERLVRRTLWLEIVQSIHNFRGNLYEWTHSQPSGCAFTTILNTEYHSIAMRYVWLTLALTHSPDKADFESYNIHVAHANYGDDDVTNISDEVIGWFNQQTITEAYLELGMTYTDETKKTTDRPYKTLEEIRFLKRAFVWDANLGHYRCPLTTTGIVEIPKWMGKGDPWVLTKLELEAAVSEAAQLSCAEYHTVLDIFEPARQELSQHIPMVFEPYTVARRVATSRVFPWCRPTPEAPASSKEAPL